MSVLLSAEGLTIITSVVVFLVIILILVVIILVAKAKLLPSGNVKLTINEEKELDVPLGGTLLNTLQNNKIFLPSACGGGGTCGECSCRVPEGGGQILPTEVNFFTRKEQQLNWRLSCQLKVSQEMKIIIPDEIFGIKEWECEVVSNKNVASFIKELVLRLPEGETLDFIPGSYIQIKVPKYEINFSDMEVEDKFKSEWDKFKLWPLTAKNSEEIERAYSMANYPAEGKDIITLNVRIATPPFDRNTGTWKKGVNPGIATTYMFNLKPGDKVKISGPFGEFHMRDTDSEMLFIGGGAGMAPLRSQLLHLFKTLENTDRKVSYWYGARSKNEIFYEEDFRALAEKFPNFEFHIALSEPLEEDKWDGPVGFIHQVIYDNYLKHHDEPEEIEYYMCGPGPMANAVQEMIDNLGVPPEMLLFDDFG